MKLSSKFKLHPLTLILFAVGLLTGYFKYIFYIFLIVAIHELGHVFIAKLFKRKIVQIEILPFGGLTKFEGKISEDIFEDLLIAIGGILFQTILGYSLFALKAYDLVGEKLFIFLNTYNIFIIGFNLLPICPLDGYKIVKLFAELFVPYRLAYVISLIFSTIFLIGAGLTNLDIVKNNTFVVIFMIFMLISEIKMLRYAEIKFYIERMNYNFLYSKRNIHDMKSMFKNKVNYIDGCHEREYLKSHFTSKYE